MFNKFPHYKQYDELDCGPACLRIICKYYGKVFTQDYLRELMHTGRSGTSLLAISDAAEELGFRTKTWQKQIHSHVLHSGRRNTLLLFTRSKKIKCTFQTPLMD